jgi:TRAP-type uncharacterized transport system fused permease subunit
VFIVPFALLMTALIKGYSVATAAFVAILSTIALSYLRKETRLSISGLVEGFRRGGIAGAQMGVASAGLGMIASCFSLTGLGFKLSTSIEMLSGGSLPIALFITMLVAILLGCGAATLAAYALVALVTAPMLVRMGVGLLQAHFFVFYFAVFSAVTPPVATGALVGSRIAGSSYMKTALEACRLTFPALVVAWLIIWNPTLIGDFAGPLAGASSLLATILFIICIQVVLFGQFLAPVSLVERGLFMVAAVGLVSYIISQSYISLFVIGALLFVFGTVWQLRRRKLLNSGT